jgi:L-fucose isomerase
LARVAVLTMSDGREFVHSETFTYATASEDQLAAALESAGHEVVRTRVPITSNVEATAQARRVADANPHLTIYNYPVWAFPHFTMLASVHTNGPLVLAAATDPQQPGMVGMLAGGGALDQVGRKHGRVWGDFTQAETLDAVLVHVRAAGAVQALRGQTFGRIGGRPMGMYTAASNSDQWLATFGVDVEEIDQWEIVRRSALVEDSRATAGRQWLEKHTRVHYDGKRLTPEVLERQVRSYHAIRELIDEWNLDFSGIKGQPELTTHFTTMDVAEAFLNDPYDWEGPKETHVTATESDMDGALTMQVMKLLSGLPVLFADVRHYHGDEGVWDLSNSGQHATWYAARSDDPAENLAGVDLHPAVFFFPAGGASVRSIARPGDATFARLTRAAGRYRMQVVRGDFVDFGDDENDRLAHKATYEWPHAFSRLNADPGTFLGQFGANHIHAVPGDITADLRQVCTLLDIDYIDLETSQRTTPSSAHRQEGSST